MNGMLIIGAASCALEDTRQAVEMFRDAGMYYHRTCIGKTASALYKPDCKYLATYHPEQIPVIRDQRQLDGCNLDYQVISHEKRPGVDIVVSDWWRPSGSSALLGVQYVLRLGYKRIILCGCPMTGINDKGGKYKTFQSGWKAHQKEVAPYVRSMCGWTQELLGAPAKEWLEGKI